MTLRQALVTVIFFGNNMEAYDVLEKDISDNFPGVWLNDDIDVKTNVIVSNIYVALSFGCSDRSEMDEDDESEAPYIRVEYICTFGQNDIEIYKE